MNTFTQKFYLFSPRWKSVNILVSSNEIFDTKLFKSLSQKIVPLWYIKLRTAPILSNIFNLFLKTEEETPSLNTFLIYHGYDSTIHFASKTDNTIGVFRKKDHEYIEEKFLGYPIHYDFSLTYIPNFELLKKILKTHWEELKNGKTKTHGDFTHNNILVDEHDKVSIIDSKPTNSNTSILTDLFYFYSYFLFRVEKTNPKMKKIYEPLLLEIYLYVFKDDSVSILDEIDNLKPENFNVSKDRLVFEYWKNEFYKFMLKIV